MRNDVYPTRVADHESVGLPIPLGQSLPGIRCTPRGSLADHRSARGWAPKPLRHGFRWYRYHSDQPEPVTRFAPREPKVAQRRNSEVRLDEGIPPEGCWQKQSGYRYHSATFSLALGIHMQV